MWAVVVIAGTAVAAVTFFATSNRQPPRLHWVSILRSLSWDGDAEGSQEDVLGQLGQ